MALKMSLNFQEETRRYENSPEHAINQDSLDVEFHERNQGKHRGR